MVEINAPASLATRQPVLKAVLILRHKGLISLLLLLPAGCQESTVFSVLRLFIIIALGGVSGCHREKPQPEPAALPQVANPDLENGAGSVWVADREGKPGRLFLCGTIHILRESDYPLSPGYEAAYNYSDKLILELPPGSGSGPAMASRMRELGLYSSDGSLEANVKPETWAAVKKWAQSRNIEASSLNRFRPWFVSLIITSTEYAALGARPDIGVDQHFETRAEREGKPAEGLESVEFQLQLFSGLTNEQQKDMLEQTLTEISIISQEYEKMIAAWKNGQMDDLHALLYREAERFPELLDLFLKNRNLTWIERLDDMLKKGENAMVLVGTGHLASDHGLIQLLKDRGYRVRHHREVDL